MSQMHQRLQQSTADFPDAAPLRGADEVATVVRRGRRRLLATRVAGGTLAVLLTAGGAAALPHLLQPTPPTPEIVGEVPATDEDAPTGTTDVEPETTESPAATRTPESTDEEPATKGDGDTVTVTVEPDPKPAAAEPAETTPTKEPKPAPEPTKTVAPAPAFTAVQAWDVTDDEPPMTVYEGTGVPGHGVWVYSEYGETFGEIRSDGTFRIEATFPHAPFGTTTFPVKVKDKVTGERVLFELTTIRKGSVGEVDFTASQQYASKEYAPPYNYYVGTATPGTPIDVTSEYGSADGTADANGRFEIKVWFEGIPQGASKTFPVTVTNRQSGEQFVFEFTGHHPGTSVAFTANQVYGESAEPVPFDVFYGTAEPGTIVAIWAEYGETRIWVETTASETGDWEVRVEFPDAPANTAIPVKAISNHTGERQWFEFVATYTQS